MQARAECQACLTYAERSRIVVKRNPKSEGVVARLRLCLVPNPLGSGQSSHHKPEGIVVRQGMGGDVKAL